MNADFRQIAKSITGIGILIDKIDGHTKELTELNNIKNMSFSDLSTNDKIASTNNFIAKTRDSINEVNAIIEDDKKIIEKSNAILNK